MPTSTRRRPTEEMLAEARLAAAMTDDIDRMLTEVSRQLNLPYVANRRQIEAHLEPALGAREPLLYGGAMGGGKSGYLCAEAIRECIEVPGNRVLMARRELKTFRATTLMTLLSFLPVGWQHKPSAQRVVAPNGSVIEYMGLGDDDDKRKLQSLEIGAFFVDEVTEIEEASFRMAGTRLRWPAASRINRFKMRATCNPEPGWVKEAWVVAPKPGWRYIKALPLDNLQNLPENYVEDMRESLPEEWFRAYMLGDWDAFVPTNTVLNPGMVAAAMRINPSFGPDRVWGLDVARYGDDSSVLAERSGLSFRFVDEWPYLSIDETADAIETHYQLARIKPRQINVDDDGVGGGVTDLLKRAQREGRLGDCRVNGVIAMKGPGPDTAAVYDNMHYANMKAQLWFAFRLLLEQNDGYVSLPPQDLLKSGLQAHRYEVRSGKATVEPKKLVKQRLGYSPDHADATILTMFEGRHDYVSHAKAEDRERAALAQLSPDERAVAVAERENRRRLERIHANFRRYIGSATGRPDDMGLGY